MQRSPVIYLAFANHSTNPLPNLEREGRVLLQTLAPREQAGDFNVHRDELISLPVMANYLREYKDQIVLFHFGGHADASSLIFLEEEAIGMGIAELLAQQSSLKLVFLNGCSTQAQVTRLLDLGIPAVIATSCSVGDYTASTFAEQFYAALAKDFTIQEAFDHAAAYLKTAGQTINFSRESRPREAVDTNHWGLFAREEEALNWKLPSKNKVSTASKIPMPSWMNKLWVKITGGLLVLWFLIQLLNNITGILADGQTALDNFFNRTETPPTSLTESCGFPKEFRDDSLYILITRFEDYISKNEADCFGMALLRRIDAKNMPIRICYLEKLTPRQRREVKTIQEEHHADLVLWGNLKNLAQGCSEGDICFRSQPSDTIVKICGGEIAPEKADLEYESGISPEEIELGGLHVGEKTFDAWLTGIFNAKVGKKKPEFFVVDESLPKLEQSELWMEKGDLFNEIKFYFRAVKCYDKSIELDPTDALVYFIRGIAKCFLRNYKGAIDDYSKAIQFDLSDASAYFIRGIAKHDLKDYKGAIDDYSTAIQLDSSDASVYKYRGIAKHFLRNYKGAIDDYSKAIQLDSSDASVYKNRGIAKRVLKDYKGAIDDYSKTIHLNPNDTSVYFVRGVAKNELKDFQGAIDDYSKAIQLDHRDTTAYNNRGVVKSNLKDYKGAIDDYSKAIQLDPNYASAYINRGNANRNLKDYKGAIDDYSKAIQLNPKNAQTYYNRGNTKRDLKNYKGAIDDYSKAIQLNPNSAAAYHNRGVVKYYLKDYKGAITDYSKAIQLDPNDSGAYNNRGVIKSDLKNYKSAIADYSKAIQLDPRYVSAYNNRGVAKRNLKNYKGAIADYSKAIQLDPNDPSAHYNRSISFQKIGDRKREKLDLKIARKLDGSRWKIIGLNVLIGLGLLIIIVFYKRIDQLLYQIYHSIRHFFKKTKHPNDQNAV